MRRLAALRPPCGLVVIRCHVLKGQPSLARGHARPLPLRRHYSDGLISAAISALPVPLVPPVILVGLTLALWTFKCINIVIFQGRIIYIPYMPPFARSEKIEDYANDSSAVQWRHEQIASLDGTRLSLMVGNVEQNKHNQEVVVLYFQGNGGSSPMRIPMLSRCLGDIQQATDRKVTVATLSYRGFWTSRGKPSQPGIEMDAQAFMTWAQATHPNAPVILWGQSLGAGVALKALADSTPATCTNIAAVILETPFVSIKRMLLALYPQKWLPYRLLWPFLRNHWDSEAALRRLASQSHRKPPMLLLPASDDEVVPPEEIEHLQLLCDELCLPYKRQNITGAYHNEVSSKVQGRRAIATFIASNVRG